MGPADFRKQAWEWFSRAALRRKHGGLLLDLPSFDVAPLSALDPGIVVKSRDDHLGAFFLTLSLVYNDFKGLVWWQSMLSDAIGRPPGQDVTPKVGQVSGMILQTTRYGVGLLQELLELIRVHEELVTGKEFQALPFTPRARGRWARLQDLAIAGKGDPFLRALASARGNVAFHYHQTKALAVGFLDHFDGRSPDPRRAHAFVSFGWSMEETRFFYADAAARAALTFSAARATFEGDFVERLHQELGEVNESIMGAIGAFLASRGGAVLRPPSAPATERPGPAMQRGPSRVTRERARARRKARHRKK